MRRLISITFVMMLAATLFSCTTKTNAPIPATPTIDLVEPGEKVGEMVLTSGRLEGMRAFSQYCDPIVEDSTPVVRKCNIPALAKLDLAYGAYFPTLDELNKYWQQVTWQLYLDGQPVDLPAFGTFDADVNIGGPVKIRLWDVVLDKPTPGMHTLHYIAKSEIPEYRTDATWEITIK